MRHKFGPDGWWFHGDTVSAFPFHDRLASVESIWFSASTADLPWTNFSHCRLPSWLTYHGLPVAYGLVDLPVATSRSRWLAIEPSQLSRTVASSQKSLAMEKTNAIPTAQRLNGR